MATVFKIHIEDLDRCPPGVCLILTPYFRCDTCIGKEPISGKQHTFGIMHPCDRCGILTDKGFVVMRYERWLP